jgi:peptide-methionine (R)-S-oxide reductase
MLKYFLFLFGVMIFGACNSQKRESPSGVTVQNLPDTAAVIHRSEKEWKSILTPEQFAILRLKGTDRPYTGQYYKTTDKGTYLCAGCGTELFTSEMKFDSDCGWPSFDRAMEGGKIKTILDTSHGMIRTEIVCATCGGHLGHLFEDGPTKTGLRYCVNSTSLNFIKEK